MGHAEAHERLADLALEPAALASLAAAVDAAMNRPVDRTVDRSQDRGQTPRADSAASDDGAVELVEHVTICSRCRLQLDGWRATLRALDLATAREDGERAGVRLDELAHDPVIPSPSGLRERVRAIASAPAGRDDVASDRPAAAAGAATAVAGDARPGERDGARARSSRTLLVTRILPIAAALAILVGGFAIQQQSSRLDSARSEVAALEGVTTVLDRLLRDPDHRVVALVGADGTARGSLAWSSRDLVVMTTALARPSAGQSYRCWVERDGVRTPVGQMWFAGRLAYWTGSLDEWATISLDKAGRFGVSLVTDGKGPAADAVLVATLPG